MPVFNPSGGRAAFGLASSKTSLAPRQASRTEQRLFFNYPTSTIFSIKERSIYKAL